MGLDMYAYVTDREGRYREYWESYRFDAKVNDYVSNSSKPREIAYWRKHPSLHGWFQREWESQSNSGDFNGDEFEITWEMLERLESAILAGNLPHTEGFFFGGDSSEDYREQDLEFVKNARAELFLGLKVFYNSSW